MTSLKFDTDRINSFKNIEISQIIKNIAIKLREKSFCMLFVFSNFISKSIKFVN